MKMFARFALATTLFAVAAPSVALAQMTEPMKFTTTFSFTVGKTNFAPGTYVARPIDGEPSVICVQSTHGGPAAFVVGISDLPRKEPSDNQITFVRQGNRMVLERLWDESFREGLEIVPHTPVTNAN